jgi:hypothetical protein
MSARATRSGRELNGQLWPMLFNCFLKERFGAADTQYIQHTAEGE